MTSTWSGGGGTKVFFSPQPVARAVTIPASRRGRRERDMAALMERETGGMESKFGREFDWQGSGDSRRRFQEYRIRLSRNHL
jgi:hypothetical protein